MGSRSGRPEAPCHASESLPGHRGPARRVPRLSVQVHKPPAREDAQNSGCLQLRGKFLVVETLLLIARFYAILHADARCYAQPHISRSAWRCPCTLEAELLALQPAETERTERRPEPSKREKHAGRCVWLGKG